MNFETLSDFAAQLEKHCCTYHDAAQQLDVHKTTIALWVERGILPNLSVFGYGIVPRERIELLKAEQAQTNLPSNSDLLTKEALSALTGLSLSTIQYYIKEGKVAAVKVGRVNYIEKNVAASLMARRKQVLPMLPIDTTVESEEGILTLEEAAVHLGLSSRSVYRYIAKGLLPFVVYKKQRFITQDDLATFAASGKSKRGASK